MVIISNGCNTTKTGNNWKALKQFHLFPNLISFCFTNVHHKRLSTTFTVKNV